MPENTVDKSFIESFESGVHVAYQRQGSKFRNCVRTKSNIVGESTTFQKYGKGKATQKGGPGTRVAAMNNDHGSVKVVLEDWYAGEWVDKLDTLKTNIDEKNLAMNAGAYALGRKTDEIIVNAVLDDYSELGVVDSTGALTLPRIMEGFEIHGGNDVPEIDRFAFVGVKQWSALMNIEEFSNADYVGQEDLPWKGGMQAKRWLGTMWMPYSGYDLLPNGRRPLLWFHKPAIGHASGADISTDITWQGPEVAWWVNNMMSQGAKLIDGTGVVCIECDE